MNLRFYRLDDTWEWAYQARNVIALRQGEEVYTAAYNTHEGRLFSRDLPEETRKRLEKELRNRDGFRACTICRCEYHPNTSGFAGVKLPGFCKACTKTTTMRGMSVR